MEQSDYPGEQQKTKREKPRLRIFGFSGRNIDAQPTNHTDLTPDALADGKVGALVVFSLAVFACTSRTLYEKL